MLKTGKYTVELISCILLMLLFFSCKIQQQDQQEPLSKQIYVDKRDGQQYSYVKIRSTYWMTENMRYNVPGSRYNPANPDSTYGRLYTWYQAQEACPEGWKVSSRINWLSLEKYFLNINREDISKNEVYVGNNIKILKSKYGWKTPGTDSLGLNILPAGSSHGKVTFDLIGESATFWTSSTHLSPSGYVDEIGVSRIISDDEEGIYYGMHSKEWLYCSCRCTRIALD